MAWIGEVAVEVGPSGVDSGSILKLRPPWSLEMSVKSASRTPPVLQHWLVFARKGGGLLVLAQPGPASLRCDSY